MKLGVVRWDGAEPPAASALQTRLERDGFDPFVWSDGPRAHYSAHSHDHDESIWVVEGEITFGAAGQSFRLGPGDRLMLPAGTVHTADAGPGGATYLIGERRD